MSGHHHHEHSGESLAPAARDALVAAGEQWTELRADVFDALTSTRPYKKGWSLEDAARFLRDNSGSHFDPRCVEAFFAGWEEVLAIFNRYQDDA